MAGFDWSSFIWRDGIHQPHADELGTGRLRAHIHKNAIEATWDGVGVDMDEARVFPRWRDDDGDAWGDPQQDEWLIEREGYRLVARQWAGDMIDVDLVEADGTVWQARGGFGFGDRYESECGTADWVYDRYIRRAAFRWSPVPSPMEHLHPATREDGEP